MAEAKHSRATHHPPASASALWYAAVTASLSSPWSDMAPWEEGGEVVGERGRE